MKKNIFVLILLFIEIIITISFIITWLNYFYFWEISSYAFTWFWVKGLLGIILFIYEINNSKIKFKIFFLGYLVFPMILSVEEFIRIIKMCMDPFYELPNEILRSLSIIIGFPLWIIYLLQERYKINKFLIGFSSILTPIMVFIVLLIARSM
jgi:hypothetical protein